VLLQLARLAELTGHIDEGCQALQHATELAPGREDLAVRLVQYCRRNGEAIKAALYLSQLLDRFPDSQQLRQLAGEMPPSPSLPPSGQNRPPTQIAPPARHPAFGTRAPGFRRRVAGFGLLASGRRRRLPGVGRRVPGVWRRDSGVWAREPGLCWFLPDLEDERAMVITEPDLVLLDLFE
jgi:hypothetical protein